MIEPEPAPPGERTPKKDDPQTSPAPAERRESAPSPEDRAVKELGEAVARVRCDSSAPFDSRPILSRLVLAAKIEALEDAARRECVQCSVSRPLYRNADNEWQHGNKPGGDILLVTGRCTAGGIVDALSALRKEQA